MSAIQADLLGIASALALALCWVQVERFLHAQRPERPVVPVEARGPWTTIWSPGVRPYDWARDLRSGVVDLPR